MILNLIRAAAISLVVCVALGHPAKAQNTAVNSESEKPVFVLVNGTFQWSIECPLLVKPDLQGLSR